MGDSEETSLDLLKNTPSNIAKLEDLIEHSKGRQKYLAHTTSPSDGDDVRWYFCKVPLLPNELAASVPKTEIVGKSEYFRFGMRDSLAIEACFLQREDELLSSWWREYAECSEGPRERISTGKKLDKQPTASTSDIVGSTELFEEVEEERVGVPVKGGLYEGYGREDVKLSICYPGSEIPKWFCYQTYGSSLNFQVPWHDCFNGNVLGFALCVVIALEEYHHPSLGNLYVYYRYKDGTYKRSTNSILVASVDRTLIDSDHVEIGYCKYERGPIPRIHKSGFTDSLLEFWLSVKSPNCRVKYCGACPIYASFNSRTQHS